VPPLHRAIALEEIQAMPVGVGEDLDFDVARPRDVFLDQHLVVAEARRRLALADASASANSAAALTMRMPLPPPPAEGFSRTG
jgi:hypothetical protein